MRLAIRHHTEYAYAAGIAGSVQYLRLWPRDDGTQTTVGWRLDAPGPVTPWRDGFGNLVHTVVLPGGTDSLVLTVEGEVDTVETHGILPLDGRGPPPEAYLRTTPLTGADAGLRDFATGFAVQRGRGTLPALHALMSAIHQTLAAQAGDGDIDATAAQALARGAGGCQDHAHLFIACCRLWGVPARYVSGYLHTQAEDGRTLATHAWAEALVEYLGWVSFDPSNCQSATQAYVRLAVGFDGHGAAPVRGVRLGGGGEQMRVRVQVMAAEQ